MTLWVAYAALQFPLYRLAHDTVQPRVLALGIGRQRRCCASALIMDGLHWTCRKGGVAPDDGGGHGGPDAAIGMTTTPTL
jgi:hypothetical protein